MREASRKAKIPSRLCWENRAEAAAKEAQVWPEGKEYPLGGEMSRGRKSDEIYWKGRGRQIRCFKSQNAGPAVFFHKQQHQAEKRPAGPQLP